MITIKEYLISEGRCPFREWLVGLDRNTRERIQARVLRFESGNMGDAKRLKNGIHEARVDFGPGYRIYFGQTSKVEIVLLIGGDKNSQAKDIWKARSFWKEYLETENAKKKPRLE